MQKGLDFEQWNLVAIREDGASLSWLEEHRFDWTVTAGLALEKILQAKTIILITDKKRKWLERYILDSINSSLLSRPIVGIVSIDALYPDFSGLDSTGSIELIEDMINLSYNENMFFWYIGSGGDKRADIAKRREDSYYWMLDEDYHNSFTLKSYDKDIDIKLLQLYKLFNLSLSASIFGEIDFNE